MREKIFQYCTENGVESITNKCLSDVTIHPFDRREQKINK